MKHALLAFLVLFAFSANAQQYSCDTTNLMGLGMPAPLASALGCNSLSADIKPSADDTYDLGSDTYAWQDIFLEGDIKLSDAGSLECTTGALTIGTVAAASTVFKTTDLARWSLDSAGSLYQNGSNGGSLALSRANTSILVPASGSIAAAGSALADATQLVNVINGVATVGAGQGVKLWQCVGNGCFIFVKNSGASDLKVYPATASGTINGGAAGAPITLSTATKDGAIFMYVGVDTWIAIEAAGAA